MINWLLKRLGYHVCEEFTRWRTIEAQYARTPMLFETSPPGDGRIRFTRCWQERECTVCGKLQQRELEI